MVGVPGPATAVAAPAVLPLVAGGGEWRQGEPGGRPGDTGHDEQHRRQARSRAQPPNPPAPAKLRAEPLHDNSGPVAQPEGRYLQVAPHQARHREHARQRCRPPARTQGGLADGDLCTDPVESAACWLDRVGGHPQRVPQRSLQAGLTWFGASVAHASRSSTDRSAARAREVWLFTAPLVIPIAAAIWASDMSA